MKIGDIVYYYEHWSDSICKAKIVQIYQTGTYAKDFNGKLTEDAAKLDCICVVDIEGEDICCTPGSCSRMIKDLFPTAQAAYASYYASQNKQIKKYCEEIKDIRDLLTFPLRHSLNGEEYTDNSACQAYKIMVKELAGIEL